MSRYISTLAICLSNVRGRQNHVYAKVVVDRHLAEALQMWQRRIHGPYKTASEAVAAMESRTK